MVEDGGVGCGKSSGRIEEGRGRRLLVASLVLLSGWILVNVLRMLWQPLIMDEVDFMVATMAWPLDAAAVPHPPGYVHLLRLLFSVLGRADTVARLPGIVCALATLWCLPAVIRRVYPASPDRGVTTLMAVWFLGLAPMTTQSAMLVDIDNTVMMPVLLFLFLLWFRCRDDGGRCSIALFGAGFAAALWVKFPPPALFIIGVGLETLWSKDWRALGRLVMGGLLGVALFALTFALETLKTGFGMAQMSGSFAKLMLLTQWHRILITFPQTMGVFVVWLGVPLSLLAAAAIARVLSRGRRPLNHAERSLAVFALISLTFYAFANAPSYGYPKYQSVTVPILAVLAARLVARGWKRHPQISWILTLLAAGATLLIGLLSGDPMLRFFRVTQETAIGELATRMTRAGEAVCLTSIPSFAVLLVVGWVAIRRKIRFSDLAWVGLAATVLGQSTVTLIAQSGAQYSTRYHYGADFTTYLEACQELESRLPPRTFVIAPKDIMHHGGFRGRFVTEIVREDQGPDTLLAVMSCNDVRALVLSGREQTRARVTLDDPQVDTLLRGQFISSRVGEYLLLLRP